MKRLILLLALSSTLLITGCTTVEKVPVYVNKTTYVRPPEALYAKQVVPPPPDQKTYANLTDIQKEDALVNYTLQLLGVIDNYGNQMDSIKDYVNKSVLLDKQK